MKRILRHTYDAFPLLIFILFIHILVLRDPLQILVMSALTAAMGLSLRFFCFRKIIWNFLARIASITILYFIMSFLLFEEIPERLLFIFTSLTVMFFGRKLYRYSLETNVFTISVISLVLSIISFLMIRRIDYGSSLLSFVVNTVIVINVIIIFFYNNRSEVAAAIGKDRKMPGKIIGSNRKMVIFALIIAAIAALIKEIVWLVETVVDYILIGIREIIIFILKLLSYRGSDSQESGGNGEMQLPEGLGEASEPSVIWIILEYVMYVILAVILLVILFFLFRKLISLAKKLFAVLMRSIESGRSKLKAEYVDIVETRSIFDVTKESLSRRLRDFIDDSSERYKAKSLREEIRYQYKINVRKLKKHGLPFTGSMTAEEIYEMQHDHTKHEILKRDFVDLYSTARYSDNEIENIK